MKIPGKIIVEHCGNDHLDPILSICEIPTIHPKPENGGLWTSHVDSEHGWREWCEEECYNIGSLEKSFRMEISTKHLLVIDKYDDLLRGMVHPGIISLYRLGVPRFDWGKSVRLYNGIWLTARGESETRYTRPYNLYGWDCETVLLFNEKPIIKVIVDYKN